MMDISSVSEKICTGCATCANICPSNAISMIANSEGFLFPVIDQKKCIHCGLCYKKCPAIDFAFTTPTMPECYAVWAQKDIREVSSSGGMFTVLAQYILRKKGIVVGAAWNSKFHVEHIIIDSEADLAKLRSSKYVQSSISEELFKDIKTYLEHGRYVLFSGCPCQVAGLKNYLGKDYDNLLCVDIVCHGVPSPLVLESYISELANGRKVKHIDFREKKYFGWSTITAVQFEDGTEYVKKYSESPWYIGFLQGIIVRECCGSCKYAKTQRVGDITLGDFWQIHKIEPKYNDWRGTSLVLINTEKGKRYFDLTKINLALVGQLNLAQELPYNGQLNRPTKITFARKEFFNLFKNNNSFVQSLNMVTNDKRDVGIIGFWSANNYGSVITYYALKKVVEHMGYSVGMIELPLEFNDTLGDMMSRRFIDKHYYTTGRLSKNLYRQLNEKFSTFLIGSDQVWNPVYVNSYGYYMFMDFVADNRKKIAYAASIGKEQFDLPFQKRQEVAYYLNKFHAVSVREDKAVDTCKEYLNYDYAVHVLDPVWLCSNEDYDEIIKDASFKEDGDFVFSYILDPTADKKEALEYAVRKLGLKHYNIADVRRKVKEGDIVIDNTIPEASMEDWLYCLKKCKFVVTDSHHGIVFALIFNKPFICFANPSRTMSRFTSLFKLFEIEDRLVYSPKDIMANEFYFSAVDYDKINKIARIEKDKSYNWLYSALKLDIKEKVLSDYDILYGKIKNIGDNVWKHGKELEDLTIAIHELTNLKEKNIQLEKAIKELQDKYQYLLNNLNNK